MVWVVDYLIFRRVGVSRRVFIGLRDSILLYESCGCFDGFDGFVTFD